MSHPETPIERSHRGLSGLSAARIAELAGQPRDINLSRQRDGTWLLEIPEVRLTRVGHPDNPRYLVTLEEDELDIVAAPLRTRIGELEDHVAARLDDDGDAIEWHGEKYYRHDLSRIAELEAELEAARDFIQRLNRITTAWTRGMYAARIDCLRGDTRAAIRCLSEGLDGYDGTEWNGTETGAEWWERTKAEERL